MSASDVRPPIFARLYVRLSRAMEKELGEHWDELLAGLTGRVVEIGAGNGMNFAHYPTTVDEVVALEPEAYLRAKAQQAARGAPWRLSVRDGLAHPLPLEDDSFRRRGRQPGALYGAGPGGRVGRAAPRGQARRPLRFLEHVRSDQPRKTRLQERLDRSGIWPRVGGGCHCARNTVAAITAAAFRIEQVRGLDVGPRWMHTNAHVVGLARAPE